MSPAASALGRPRVHLRQIGSTNDRARELASAGAPHGTLVTASSQTAGRGRQGRRWSAPTNSSLLMSLVLRCSPPPTLLPLIAAVAVCDVAGGEAAIKWPNDIVLVRSDPAHPLAKLAGILAEGRPQEGWTVLGIGVNVAVRVEDLSAELGAGAHYATLGHTPDAVEPTLQQLLTALQQRLAEPVAATLDAWRARDALYGREIAWGSGRGRAAGIDGTGRLIVSLAGGGRTTLDAGEVHLRS
jgi:BirA family transcriptional regulator, biotin operon repressor / biotin---[acetyl-CoA-carboxylase] ligase